MKTRAAVSILSLVLAAASIANYAHDRAQREPVRKFLHEFTIDQRRPVETEVLELAPAADLATDASSLAALDDALGSVNLADKTPQERALWLASVERVPDELQQAVRLGLSALRARPGWPYHLFMTGKLAYVLERRTAQQEYRPEQWIVPLTMTTSRIPSDVTAWTFLGGAYLESWPDVPARFRSSAPSVVRRAFGDPEFTAAALPLAFESFGASQTIAMLPDRAPVLFRAIEQLKRGGDLPLLASVYARWRRAEWRARLDDLAEVGRRYELSDIEGLRSACTTWASRHRISDFDDPEGRRQVARVLELWPDDRGGAWASDPRGEMIRYFLDGREQSVRGIALARSAAVLSDVPEVTTAICRLAGGDFYAAQRMMVASETARSFEWTPFIVRLARERISSGDLDNARDALDYLAPGAQQECDVLLVRRDLLDAEKKSDIEVTRELAALASPAYASDDFSDNGTLSVCVDPRRFSSQQLSVRYDVPSPSLVEYGWGDGVSAAVLLDPRHASVALPLSGLTGRRSYTLHVVAGSRPVPIAAAVGSN